MGNGNWICLKLHGDCADALRVSVCASSIEPQINSQVRAITHKRHGVASTTATEEAKTHKRKTPCRRWMHKQIRRREKQRGNAESAQEQMLPQSDYPWYFWSSQYTRQSFVRWYKPHRTRIDLSWFPMPFMEGCPACPPFLMHYSAHELSVLHTAYLLLQPHQ